MKNEEIIPLEEGGIVALVDIDSPKVELKAVAPVCPACATPALLRYGRCITCIECGWSSCEI